MKNKEWACGVAIKTHYPSVHLYARNISRTAEHIFMKFNTGEFYKKCQAVSIFMQIRQL
jgi:hypothetical protein